MNRPALRPSLIAVGTALVALLAAGCGSSDDTSDTPAGTEALAFELTDAGCVPNRAEAPAGPVFFEVENAGTSLVSEFEVLDGVNILGEVEHLTTEGDSGTLSLNLAQGEYQLYCPGGASDKGTLVVSGELKTGSSPEAEEAVARYRDYLEENTAKLVAATEPFVAAVIAGNVAEAKALYPAARIPYERIEPVAESFGTLDPRIDARENDVPADEFEGFHRIEKALWEEGATNGMAPVAKQLLADVEELQDKVKTVNLQAVQIANGANELLGEVSASKITGEEERYSHTDLVDFETNVEGAEVAFEAVEPLLSKDDPKLAKEIEASFESVYSSLDPYRQGDGFVPYTELSQPDTRKLAQEIDALAELLSEVPAKIVGGASG